MVNEREIEANPDKIQASIDLRAPTKVKEIQSLTGRIATLSVLYQNQWIDLDRSLKQ